MLRIIVSAIATVIVLRVYLRILREPRPRVKPVGYRIPRPRRRELRKNRYTLPGEWS